MARGSSHLDVAAKVSVGEHFEAEAERQTSWMWEEDDCVDDIWMTQASGVEIVFDAMADERSGRC